jgi:hypothetical protein
MPLDKGALAESALRLLFNADNLTLEKMQSIADHFRTMTSNFQKEIQRVKDFKIDIHWKSRVINVPAAINHFRDLIDELTVGLKAKIFDIGKPFADFVHTQKLLAEGAGGDVLAGGPGAPSKIVTAFNELQDFVTGLNGAIGDFDKALVAASDLTLLFDRVLKDIETLEDVFLSQKSKRTKTTATYFKRSA